MAKREMEVTIKPKFVLEIAGRRIPLNDEQIRATDDEEGTVHLHIDIFGTGHEDTTTLDTKELVKEARGPFTVIEGGRKD